MYKRKFPKTSVENASSQLHKKSTNSSLNGSTPSMSLTCTSTSTSLNENKSPESPSILDNFDHFPVVNNINTEDDIDVDNTTDCSEPLFNDGDDVYSYLKQTLMSCGLHLKIDQNILCKSIICDIYIHKYQFTIEHIVSLVLIYFQLLKNTNSCKILNPNYLTSLKKLVKLIF
jgi:hypothetical protein